MHRTQQMRWGKSGTRAWKYCVTLYNSKIKGFSLRHASLYSLLCANYVGKRTLQKQTVDRKGAELNALMKELMRKRFCLKSPWQKVRAWGSFDLRPRVSQCRRGCKQFKRKTLSCTLGRNTTIVIFRFLAALRWIFETPDTNPEAYVHI